jgi:hypothetical protein
MLSKPSSKLGWHILVHLPMKFKLNSFRVFFISQPLIDIDLNMLCNNANKTVLKIMTVINIKTGNSLIFMANRENSVF